MSKGVCYSDHNEDIRTKGSCDYCGGTENEHQERRQRAPEGVTFHDLTSFIRFCRVFCFSR